MLPTQDTRIVAEDLGHLIGAFQNKPTLKALLGVFLARQQTLENVFWSILRAGLFATPPVGNALDQLGAIVDELRGGFNDVQYLLWIKVIIRARRSGGRAEDIIQICALVLGPEVAQPSVAVVPSFDYEDHKPACFDVTSLDIETDYAEPMAQALGLARAAGTYGVLRWSDWDPSTNLVLGDVVSGTLASGLRDRVSNAYPTVPISAIAL